MGELCVGEFCTIIWSGLAQVARVTLYYYCIPGSTILQSAGYFLEWEIPPMATLKT